MSLLPKFWRHRVILVDTPATPLAAVISQLRWSCDCHLKVIVTRRAFCRPINGQHDRLNINAIMKILLLHIHHIRKLCFSVMFSSSLPSFQTDFHSTAVIMERLKLQCTEDDSCTNYTEPVTAATHKEEAKFPKLMSLVIDGDTQHAPPTSESMRTLNFTVLYFLDTPSTLSHIMRFTEHCCTFAHSHTQAQTSQIAFASSKYRPPITYNCRDGF